MFENHFTTEAGKKRFQESVRPENRSLENANVAGSKRLPRLTMPAWFKRLTSRRTRMTQQFYLSDKDGN